MQKKSSGEKGKASSGTKTKQELDEERHRYDFLGEEDLTPNKNPKRFELLFPATRNYVENAGISGEEAEKNDVTWTVLMNSLRFLKVCITWIVFSKKPPLLPLKTVSGILYLTVLL
jgi:hypothetical protein